VDIHSLQQNPAVQIMSFENAPLQIQKRTHQATMNKADTTHN